MISIMKYLTVAPKDEVIRTLFTIVDSLLEAMVRNAVRGDTADWEKLQSDVAAIRGQLRVNGEPDELLLHAGSVMKALGDYNRRTTSYMSAQSKELQALRERLRTFQRETVDPVTGLQGRSDAEAMLATLIAEHRNAFGTIFVLDRMHTVNGRFGRVIGDEFILMLSRHVAQLVKEYDQMFRWSGPALLLLQERAKSLRAVQIELAPIATHKLQKKFEMGERLVLLPIAFAYMTVPIVLQKSIDAVVRRFDSFASSRLGADDIDEL